MVVKEKFEAMSTYQKNILFWIIFTLCPCTFTNVEAVDQNLMFNVGYKVLEWKYFFKGKENSLAVAVWYPASSQPKSYVYCGPAKGNVAVDGAINTKSGPYPLMVFSHGYGGTGLGSVFFTEALAGKGWIVVAPDHNDKDSIARIRTGLVKGFDSRVFLKNAKVISDSGPDDRDSYLYRIEEMKRALECILDSDYFGSHIDKNKIAVGGHSFGGFTALGLCGTIEEYLDNRIKAVLLFSTGAGGYLFRESELSLVKIPSMYIFGEKEKEQKRGSKTMMELADKVFQNLPSPKYLLEIKGANHFSFVNRIKNGLMPVFFSGTKAQFDVINNYSIAFLQKYAAGINSFNPVLEQKDPILNDYIVK